MFYVGCLVGPLVSFCSFTSVVLAINMLFHESNADDN